MWISKEELYEQIQKLERNNIFYETEFASRRVLDAVSTKLALLTKDVEFLTQQIAELKKRLED